ncbi:MAG TPA: hypothetical protein ENH91_08910 [Leeuwenhoekiella sp.]|nr:hypothetical protein [Leeuwenhoekiella sp.]
MDYVDGTFQTRDVYEALEADTKQKKNNVRTGLFREAKAGTIEGLGKYGSWRKVDDCVSWEDVTKIDGDLPKGLGIKLPMGLGSEIPIYPGDLIVIAGVKSCGKSAFALETVVKNQNQEILYFSSELTKQSIQKRANDEEPKVDLGYLSHMKFAKRFQGNFHDVVEPGKINIIDYLSPPVKGDESMYFSIPAKLEQIHNKLDGSGIAIVCLQKDPGKTSGDGGPKTRHKANIYITLDQSKGTNMHWLNIQVCKVRPLIEGFKKQYGPQPFSLKSRSDLLPP